MQSDQSCEILFPDLTFFPWCCWCLLLQLISGLYVKTMDLFSIQLDVYHQFQIFLHFITEFGQMYDFYQTWIIFVIPLQTISKFFQVPRHLNINYPHCVLLNLLLFMHQVKFQYNFLIMILFLRILAQFFKIFQSASIIMQ